MIFIQLFFKQFIAVDISPCFLINLKNIPFSTYYGCSIKDYKKKLFQLSSKLRKRCN